MKTGGTSPAQFLLCELTPALIERILLLAIFFLDVFSCGVYFFYEALLPSKSTKQNDKISVDSTLDLLRTTSGSVKARKLCSLSNHKAQFALYILSNECI